MSMKMKQFFTGMCLLAVVLMFQSRVEASPVGFEIMFDFNRLAVQAKDAQGGNNVAFTDNFTGFLEFGMSGAGSGSALYAVLIDGFVQPGLVGSLTGVTGGLEFTSGAITGADIAFDITNPDTHVDTLNFTIPAGSNVTVFDFGGSFGVVALGEGNYSITETGTPDGLFGGVDIGDGDEFFVENSPGLFSEFLFFRYSPDANGLDEAVDMDIRAMIPAPPAVLAGGALLGLLAIGRKLKSKREKNVEDADMQAA